MSYDEFVQQVHGIAADNSDFSDAIIAQSSELEVKRYSDHLSPVVSDLLCMVDDMAPNYNIYVFASGVLCQVFSDNLYLMAKYGNTDKFNELRSWNLEYAQFVRNNIDTDVFNDAVNSIKSAYMGLHDGGRMSLADLSKCAGAVSFHAALTLRQALDLQ